MQESNENVDWSDGECRMMSISAEQLLFGAELLLCDDALAASPRTDTDADKSDPESPKVAPLKRSLEFFAAKPSDNTKESSTEANESSNEPKEASNQESESPQEGRKKLRAALSGSQGSLVNIDTLEDFSNLNF